MSNFDFIDDIRLNEIKEVCKEAESCMNVVSSSCAIMTRKALELSVKWVYGIDSDLKIPFQQTLATLIHDQTFKSIINEDMHHRIIYIQKLGNQAVHSNVKITKQEALTSLKNLHDFLQWITYSYSENYNEHEFDEKLIFNTQNYSIDIKSLIKTIESKEKTIDQLKKQYKDANINLNEMLKNRVSTIPFDIKDISEFQTRKQYIDLDLKIAGWEFNKDIIEELKVENMPNKSNEGYVDYVLMGNNGKPLAIVEAKRTTKDARVGQEQARIYADCLELKHGQRPVIYFTNGFEIYMWDDKNYPYRKVSGFYTKEELQLLMDRRTTKGDLRNISIDSNITNRTYQQEAIKSFCDDLSKKERKGLFVMATGTGKTRTAISVVDVLTRNNWVKNVLFLADRAELIKQAKKNFNKLLPSLSTANLLTEKENCENVRMIFSTYQTMMNAIDDTKNKYGNKLFTVGHFDLIIVDEAHRSIYKKYQAIFEYFDGYLLGLTATPRSDLDKNTYKIFDLQDNIPTYSFEYDEAVKGGFLVDYHTIECATKFMRDGIKYDELSEKDKEEYEETFSDIEEVSDYIAPEKMNTWLFNFDTIDKVLSTLMEKGLKINGNDSLGKTIIFAKNHRHAVMIEERFNKLYPQYHGEFARVIDIHTNYYSSLIDNFSEHNKMPQIAVSVDMLDTGIDVPEVLNLVFFKDVKSKVKFLQMIGRGTRLCKNLLGLGKDKKEFYIFDVCSNFEFFKQNPKGIESSNDRGLSQFIFELKVDILKELSNSNYFNDESYIKYKNSILNDLVAGIHSLNTNRFDVKQKLKFVEKYKESTNWQSLTDISVKEIKDNISILIFSNDKDEAAKQFDRVMYSIILNKITNSNYSKETNKVYKVGTLLSSMTFLMEEPVVNDAIKKIMNKEYIKNTDIFDIDSIREKLREYIKFIPVVKMEPVITNMGDEIYIIDNDGNRIVQDSFEDYKKKVGSYLLSNLDNKVISKINNNEKISKAEIDELENILFKDLNSNEEEFESNFNGESLLLLVRKTVGLSKEAIDLLFSDFINKYTLNIEQTRFVNLIKGYIMQNGVIDKRILNEQPFNNYGSIVDIFDGKLDLVQLLVYIINLINMNGGYTQEN